MSSPGQGRERSIRPRGAVASPHHAATARGCEVLARGGNALDAAIAVNAMLSVAYPHMCGVGGDMFLLYFEARSGKVRCLNGTGPAPLAATRAAYAERGHEAVPARGPLSVTVPGTVAAWGSALERFGTVALRELLEPAIGAAEGGVEIGSRLSDSIRASRQALRADPTLARRFLDADGEPLEPGMRLRQPELARTLRRIAEVGPGDFYTGEIGRELASAFDRSDGLLTVDDLERYAPSWVAPIQTSHAGLDVLTAPPNSQGVTALLMLDRMAGARSGSQDSPAYIRAFLAAKRAAFDVRDRYVTDPDHMAVSAEALLRGEFDPAVVSPTSPPPGGDTCYFCTADSAGNACSAIQSIAYSFGSAFVAGDTGVLLHDRGHYFSLDPDHPNRLEPGKRPLHTLMPCMALERGRPRFVFGTMGAHAQPQINVQVLHRLLDGCEPQAAVSAPRLAHGRFVGEDEPDVLHVEADFDPETLAALRATTPKLDVLPPRDARLGHAHALSIRPDGGMSAGADPRSDGSAEVIA